MPRLNVLVVGASVAGPAAAHWLARAGANVTVLERFPSLRRGGQSIDIRTSGVAVMRRMPGMEAAVRAKTTGESGMCLVDDSGRPGAVLRPSGNPDEQTLISEFEIFRGELSQILYDMTREHERIEYVFGDQISAMRQRSGHGPVAVDFTNGLPPAEYDLVVACDGATSRTRAMAFDCGVRDHIRPLGSWAAYWTLPQDLLDGGRVGMAWNSVGGRFVAIGPDPAGGSRVTLFKCAPIDTPDATAGFNRAAKEGTDSLKDFVADTFRDAKWKVPEALKGMRLADDFYASELVQVRMPTYHTGRVVLVGDAAYGCGFNGAGTSLALTGAYVLAGEISTHGSDLQAALRAYEERMMPIAKTYKIPPVMPAAMAPQTAWGLWIRNALFNFAARTSKLFNFAGSVVGGSLAINDHGLPDYKFKA